MNSGHIRFILIAAAVLEPLACSGSASGPATPSMGGAAQSSGGTSTNPTGSGGATAAKGGSAATSGGTSSATSSTGGATSTATGGASVATTGGGSNATTGGTGNNAGGMAATGGAQGVGGGATGGKAATSGGASAGGAQSGGATTGGKAGIGGGSTGGTTTVGGASTGGSSAVGGASTGGSSAVGGATGTPGCNGSKTPPTSPSGGYLTVSVNGTSRQYMLELPTGYDGTTPQPVMFAFHGTGSNAQEFIGNSGYGNVSQGAAKRVILVGPNGLSRGGSTGWINFGGSGGEIAQDDFDFFDALMTQLKANYCVDTSRVFVMGHSAGGLISNYLGCMRGNVLRGIGPFSGWGPNRDAGGGTISLQCLGKKVATYVVHNPKEGDATECAKAGGCQYVVDWPTLGWPSTQYWTNLNGCGDIGAMPTAAFSGSPPCKPYSGCDSNYPVTLCLYDYSDQYDGPHAFPMQWGAKAVTDFFLALPRVQ